MFVIVGSKSNKQLQWHYVSSLLFLRYKYLGK